MGLAIHPEFMTNPLKKFVYLAYIHDYDADSIINSTGEKTANDKKDDEDVGVNEDKDGENEYGDDKGDESEDDKDDDNVNNDDGGDDDDDE